MDKLQLNSCKYIYVIYNTVIIIIIVVQLSILWSKYLDWHLLRREQWEKCNNIEFQVFSDIIIIIIIIIIRIV